MASHDTHEQLCRFFTSSWAARAVCVQDKQKQVLDMQNIVEQFVKLENSDDNIKISNDGTAYFDLRKIYNAKHQNRKEIDNDKGQYTPLSKFYWLTQKIKNTMAFKKLKEQALNLISKAKTKETLDAIATWAYENSNEQLKSDITLLKGTLSELDRKKRLGLISNSDETLMQNQLNDQVLGVLNSVEEANLKAEESTIDTVPKEKDSKKSESPNPKHPLSIFISYSKRDNELREELDTHLAGLRRRKIVTNWDDRHIIGGELWDDTIKTKLKEADIILFLVSAHFIATDYIWEHEIPIAEEQRQKGKARVVPIILKPCQWTKLDFAKHQALPSKGMAITTFSDRDTAWLEVVEGIEKVINDVLKP
jgi:TIR domain/Effector-associated domain 11